MQLFCDGFLRTACMPSFVGSPPRYGYRGGGGGYRGGEDTHACTSLLSELISSVLVAASAPVFSCDSVGSSSLVVSCYSWLICNRI